MPATEAQKRAKAKYERSAYSKVLLRIRNDGEITRDMIEQAATAEGKTVNAFILEAVREKMQK